MTIPVKHEALSYLHYHSNYPPEDRGITFTA
jgi:hypothetical protein